MKGYRKAKCKWCAKDGVVAYGICTKCAENWFGMKCSYHVLRKVFAEDLAKLQEDCKHAKKTKPVEIHWAPGHSTGMMARFCLKCNKKFEVRNEKK